MAVSERWATCHNPAHSQFFMPVSSYADVWFGDNTTYPTGRGQQQAPSGWSCPGCGHCFSPSVAVCMYCPQQPVSATGANELLAGDEDYER